LWGVRTEDKRVNVTGRSLAEALCRGALKWHELRGSEVIPTQPKESDLGLSPKCSRTSATLTSPIPSL
jgi:hypothetical protein